MIIVVAGDAARIKKWDNKSKLTPKECKFLKSLFRHKTPINFELFKKQTKITNQVFFLNLRNLSKKNVLDWEWGEPKGDSVKINIQDPTETCSDDKKEQNNKNVSNQQPQETIKTCSGDKKKKKNIPGVKKSKIVSNQEPISVQGDCISPVPEPMKSQDDGIIPNKKPIKPQVDWKQSEPKTVLAYLINNNNKIKYQIYIKLKKEFKKEIKKKGAQPARPKRTPNKKQSKHELSGYKPNQKWNVLKNPHHKSYSRVSKAAANEIIESYNQVRVECGYRPYYQAIKYKDKFVAVALFCYEHNTDPLEYFRFAPEAYHWLSNFPGPANMAGPHMMNAWLDKEVKRTVGGKKYRQPVLGLKDQLIAAGFNNEYTEDDCRYIQSVAIDHAQFGNVDLKTVQFGSEIKWMARQIKEGKVKV